jgi:preprotein translocase subunit SecE
MAMNRETRRMLQKQGQMTADGSPTTRTRERRPAPAPRPQEREKRSGPLQFLREVRGELRKVVWPTRSEVINYSIIVLVCLIILTAFVAAQDWFWNWSVFNLYGE